jgi:formylglycine-generating enzyme required for sulfatase activity
MGNNNYSNEKPAHTVTVKSFSIGKYEVTQQEWREIMGNTPGSVKGDNRPVATVSWNDAIEYCNKRSVKEGLTPAYRNTDGGIVCDWNANGYRLPTEAEWEYAAKGGGKGGADFRYSGSDNAKDVAWCAETGEMHSYDVGLKAPNALGIYDMSGNVFEWCWDWYGNYSGEPQTDPRGAPSESTGRYGSPLGRVMRGGSFMYVAENSRNTFRYSETATTALYHIGIRLARSAP